MAGGELIVRSPADGVIVAAHAASGQAVAASAILFSIARMDRLWVRVPVFAGEAPRVDSAKGADVLRLGDPSDAPGVRARAATGPPRADANAASVDLTFELANRGSFRPGERVLVRLSERGEVEGLVVPDSAILRDQQGGTWVYERIAPQKFARRRVEIRQSAGDVVLLARGPAVGAMVVTVGAAELFGIEFGAGK
jgi:multidrug efflux pump subunit AcrA (membrane-fusion protein)